MNFIRKHILLISIIAGFILLLIGCVMLLMNQYNESIETAQKLDEMQGKRDELLNLQVHLTPQNVKKMMDNVKAQQTEIEKSVKLFSQGVTVKPMNGNEFYNFKYNVFKDLLGKLRQKFIAVPDRFQFGFETYQNKPPEDAHTPTLQKQLEIIRELMLICANSQIEEIKDVNRVEFEAQGEGSSDHNASKEPFLSLGSDFTNVENPGDNYLYSVMPFDLELLCSPESLRAFLNELAKSKYLLIPRIMKVDNPQKDKLTATKNGEKQPTQAPSNTEADIEAMLNGRRKQQKAEGEKEQIVDPIAAPFVIGDPKEKITVKIRINWLEMQTPSEKEKAPVEKSRKKEKAAK